MSLPGLHALLASRGLGVYCVKHCVGWYQVILLVLVLWSFGSGMATSFHMFVAALVLGLPSSSKRVP
jgi:hypothetical protein